MLVRCLETYSGESTAVIVCALGVGTQGRVLCWYPPRRGLSAYLQFSLG